MKDVCLHRMEERFDESVISDLPRTVHALHDPQLGCALLEGTRSVLNAPISMEEQPRPGTAAMHRSIKCLQSELYILPRTVAPTQYSATVLVHHHRQVTIDGAHLQVRDVAHPDLIGAAEI